MAAMGRCSPPKAMVLDPRTIAPYDCIEYIYGSNAKNNAKNDAKNAKNDEQSGPMTICPNPDHNW